MRNGNQYVLVKPYTTEDGRVMENGSICQYADGYLVGYDKTKTYTRFKADLVPEGDVLLWAETPYNKECRERRERIATAAMQGILSNQRLVDLIIEDIGRKETDEEKRERYIVHIDENYLQTLYVQKNAVSQEDRMEVYNKVYNEIIDFLDGKTDKPATMAYDWVDEYGNPRHSWWVENIDGQWQSGKAFTKQKPAKPNTLTEDEVYDYYQERSTTAGSSADQLAWMFVVMMTGGLISGHAFQTFSVCASLAAVYMLLSVTQAVWQTFTSWLFKQQVKKMDVAPDDYPSWVGGGAWLFFWAKMITIASAVIYFVKAIFF